jgi:protein TonB
MNLLNNEQKMLDIVFAKRNKNYGAYAIRSAYGSTVFRSLFIVAFTVLSSAGLAYWLKENHSAAHETGQVDTKIYKEVEFNMKPKEEVAEMNKAKKAPAGGPVKNNSSTSTIINDHALDTAKHVTNAEIIPINTNTSTETGTPTTSSLTGTGPETPTITIISDPVEPFGVDEDPKFKGGRNALLAFVRDHLVYPGPAVEAGKQGTLYAKFVVDEEGNVSKIFLQNNLGFGLDDEAVRVLKMIPKFESPGKVKGKPVKTYYQIPIKFKLG